MFIIQNEPGSTRIVQDKVDHVGENLENTLVNVQSSGGAVTPHSPSGYDQVQETADRSASSKRSCKYCFLQELYIDTIEIDEEA